MVIKEGQKAINSLLLIENSQLIVSVVVKFLFKVCVWGLFDRLFQRCLRLICFIPKVT